MSRPERVDADGQPVWNIWGLRWVWVAMALAWGVFALIVGLIVWLIRRS